MTDQPDAPNGSSDAGRVLAEAIQAVFAVEGITTGAGNGRTIRLQGQLLTDSESAYAHIASRFEALGYTPVIRANGGAATVTAIPGVFATSTTRDRGAVILFVGTVLSMLFAAGAAQAPDLDWLLRNPLAGLPFAASLLAILVAHEMGHYWMSRRLGISASLPYFIPMPLSLFGTMGAIMRTRSPMRNRKQVLAIGAAGPIAGLVLAIPILIFGLLRSQVQPIPMQEGLIVEGNSLLYVGLKYLIFGQILPRNGVDVFLDPVAFAAWAGLLLTSLNLIPAGQLDGGHIAYALLGRRAKWLSRLAILATAALGLIWNGWFIWTALLFVFGQRNAEPLDDITPLNPKERALAIGLLLMFVLLFTPVPMSIS